MVLLKRAMGPSISFFLSSWLKVWPLPPTSHLAIGSFHPHRRSNQRSCLILSVSHQNGHPEVLVVYKLVGSFFPVMWDLLVHRWPYVLKCFLSGSLTYSHETRKKDELPVALTSLWQLKSNKISSLLGRTLWLGRKGHETPVLSPSH